MIAVVRQVLLISQPLSDTSQAESSPDLREVVGPSGAILRITVRAVEHGAAVRALVNRTAAGLTIPTDGPDLDRAVSFGRSVLEEAETVVDVWKPLLDKINRFSEIMAEVAQIITAVAEVRQPMIMFLSHPLTF